MGEKIAFGEYKGLSNRAANVLKRGNWIKQDIYYLFETGQINRIRKESYCGKLSFNEIVEWASGGSIGKKLAEPVMGTCPHCDKSLMIQIKKP